VFTRRIAICSTRFVAIQKGGKPVMLTQVISLWLLTEGLLRSRPAGDERALEADEVSSTPSFVEQPGTASILGVGNA
jgi:hypothetical protein